MEQLFTNLSHAVEGAPLLALGASVAWGVLSIILSPCHLASIPLIVGFINDQGVTSTRRASISTCWVMRWLTNSMKARITSCRRMGAVI